MCTVTFIPRPVGYYLAMNRDEKLTRVAGTPPRRRNLNDRWVISPSEPNGGTWISVNDGRASFALINWYSVAARVAMNTVTRGSVVNAVSSAVTPDQADVELVSLSLHWINPFRLIGFFSDARKIAEWQWDLKKLVRKDHLWRSRQWISSGFDEPTAQKIRGKTFKNAQRQRASDTIAWLRRLHQSHTPEVGPFSICMHRTDAATVSYTEIRVTGSRVIMRYRSVAPCGNICDADTTCSSITIAAPSKISMEAKDSRRFLHNGR